MISYQDISIKALPLFLRIRNDHPSAHSIAYYLEYVTFHMPDNMLLPSLEWMIKNGITGQRFLDFIKDKCQDSGLELIRQLTMRLEKDKKPRVLTIKDIK